MPTVASKSSWLSPLNKMCCISKTANVLSGEKLCLDMFWIYFTLNDRLTLIPHIFGLSTQWQVHMVCFAEMHPNPASEKLIRIHFFFPPQQESASWSGAGLGLLGINDTIFRCQVLLWSSQEHHTSPVRQNQMVFLHNICPPRCILVYLVFFAAVSTCLFSSGAEAAKVKSPFTSFT